MYCKTPIKQQEKLRRTPHPLQRKVGRICSIYSALSTIVLFPFQQIPYKKSCRWARRSGRGAEPGIPLLLGLLPLGAGAARQGLHAGAAGRPGDDSWDGREGGPLPAAQLWPQIFTDKRCWSDAGRGTQARRNLGEGIVSFISPNQCHWGKKIKTRFHDLKMSHCTWKLSSFSAVSVCLREDTASPHSPWFIYISRSAFLPITFLIQPFRKLMGK